MFFSFFTGSDIVLILKMKNIKLYIAAVKLNLQLIKQLAEEPGFILEPLNSIKIKKDYKG